MKQWVDRALLGLHVAGACVLIALTLLICYDVAGRLFFNRPFAGTAEVAGVGLVLLTYMQTPYVIRHRKLLRVTFFIDRFPPAVRSQLNALAYLFGGAFFLGMALVSWQPALVSWATGEFYGNDAFRVASWPLRFGTLILWIISGLVCIGFIVEGVRGKLTRKEDDLLPE